MTTRVPGRRFKGVRLHQRRRGHLDTEGHEQLESWEYYDVVVINTCVDDTGGWPLEVFRSPVEHKSRRRGCDVRE